MSKLGVAGLRPATEKTGPEGIHLRWLFAPSLGYPNKGAVVYRLPTEKLPWVCQPAAMKLPGGPVASGSSTGPYRLHYSGEVGQLSAIGPADGPILSVPNSLTGRELVLVFAEPVLRCRVTVRAPRADLWLRAFSGEVEVDRVTEPASARRASLRVLDVGGSLITAVGVSLNAREIVEVCVTPARLDWGDAIATLGAPRSADEALNRLEPSLSNRYAGSRHEAMATYKEPAGEIVKTLATLLAPGTAFVDPGAPPDQLITWPQADHPIRGHRPQQLLLLAATDPNIARMLDLLWVDRDDAPDGPEPGTSYSYRIVAAWSGGAEANGYAIDIGAEPGPLPDLGPGNPVEGNVIAGRRWVRSEPRSRVALRWRRPVVPSGSPAAPVAFDVERRHGGRSAWLTEKQVVIVPASAWSGQGACFIDPDVPLGKVRFDVRPVDLFGQVGEAMTSPEIDVRDMAAPPPPVRTVTSLRQPGWPWRTPEDRAATTGTATLGVGFEYGAAQHEQAPDADRFRLYWRADRPLDETAATYAVVATELVDDATRRWTLGLEGDELDPIDRFVGGVLRIGAGGPAMDRRAFAIRRAIGPNQIVVTGPADLALPAGHCILRSDAHRRDLWTRVGPDIALVPGTAVRLGSGFDDASRRARVAATPVPHRAPVAPPVPPFLSPPAEPAPSADDRSAVELPIELCEAGALDGATLTVAAQSYTITGSAAGPHTVVDLDGSPTLSGADVELNLPADGVLHFIELTDPLDLDVHGCTGELAFRVDGELAVARVIGRHGARLLVRVVGGRRPAANQRGTFRPRYHLDVTVTVAAGATGDLSLAVTEGTRTGHLALTTVDVRGNEGPLSAAVPFTVVRPPPEGTPSPPWPCDTPQAEIGYSTPPDANGRATICLGWNAEPGLRYEVARALDSTIVAVDRRGWRDADRPPGLGTWEVTVVAVEELADSQVVRFDLPTGVDGSLLVRPALAQGGHLWRIDHIGADRYQVEPGGDPDPGPATLLGAPVRPARTTSVTVAVDGVTVTVSPVDPDRLPGLRGGRLDVAGHRYQITAATASGNARAAVGLRAITAGAPEQPTGNGDLHEPPDHSRIVSDPTVLAALAVKPGNDDAFSLVTGVPVPGSTYRDELPGRGSNAFFYRIRGVDPAGNGTPWSAPSVPIRLADTSRPAAPAQVTAAPGERQVTLQWRHDPAHWSTTYRILRSGPGATNEVDVGAVAAAERRDHSYIDSSAAGLLPGESYRYRVVAVKAVPLGSDRLVTVATASEPVAARSYDPRPPDPPADLVAVVTAAGVELSWTTAEAAGWLVKRFPPGSSFGQVLEAAGDASAGSDDGVCWRYTYLDLVGPDPTATEDALAELRGARYEVTLINRLGRTSTPATTTVEVGS